MLKTINKFFMWSSHSYYKKLLLLTLIFLTLLFIVKTLFYPHHEPVSPNKVVEVIKLKPRDLHQTIRLLGTIHPKHTSTLIAKGNGVLNTLVASGQKTTKGTLIAEIDSSDLEKRLQLSVSTEAIAKKQYERLKLLGVKGYISTKEIDEKKQAWIDAQKELSQIQMDVENLHFYAPFDGIVGAYKIREGSHIKVGDIVVSMYDPTSLVVDVDIPCSNLSNINEGQRVRVLSKSYRLSHLQKMLDEDTHMCPADVDIHCDNCLVGSTVPVDLVISEKKNTLVIPFQAVFLRNGKSFVYIVDNGKIAMKPVKIGIKEKDQVEILTGLQAGQQLVIKGQDRLYPEMRVDIYHPVIKS